MFLCILGRQPAFGLAELESRFGSDNVVPVGGFAAQINASSIAGQQFGSIVKVAKPLGVLETTDWKHIVQDCLEQLPSHLATLPDGKLKLGFSIYGLPVSLKTLQRSALEIKKAVRASGRSVRVVPNTAPQLNSAQIIHNQLTGQLGQELLFIRDGNRTHVAQTVSVQNIDDYTQRDFGRPRRDAFVGMLPPKLAQTMLNLAQVTPGSRVLDPFCGTGVVLQEAALMGCHVYGSDINERMVRYSRDNLNWLKETYNRDFDFYLEILDATSATWRPPISTVVCETYLGKPLTVLPPTRELEAIMHDCDDITRRFLSNLKPQLTPGTRCCIAVPAWFTGQDFLRLKVIDDLEKIGYNQISFKHLGRERLIYHRSDQLVARELLVLTVKEL